MKSIHGMKLRNEDAQKVRRIVGDGEMFRVEYHAGFCSSQFETHWDRAPDKSTLKGLIVAARDCSCKNCKKQEFTLHIGLDIKAQLEVAICPTTSPSPSI